MTTPSQAEKEAVEIVDYCFGKGKSYCGLVKQISLALSKRDQRIGELKAKLRANGIYAESADNETFRLHSRITKLETELRELRKGKGK